MSNVMTQTERNLLARINDCTKPVNAADRNAVIQLIERLTAFPVEQHEAAPVDEEDERALPATDGYFVYDRAGGHVEFYDTDAERDAAHREAIAEYRRDAIHDQEWPTEVEGIVSGVVTHMTCEREIHGAQLRVRAVRRDYAGPRPSH